MKLYRKKGCQDQFNNLLLRIQSRVRRSRTLFAADFQEAFFQLQDRLPSPLRQFLRL